MERDSLERKVNRRRDARLSWLRRAEIDVCSNAGNDADEIRFEVLNLDCSNDGLWWTDAGPLNAL